MFVVCKLVFVDLFKWDVFVFDGCYEVDQFDDVYVIYLVFVELDGRYFGLVWLLLMIWLYIFDSFYVDLCEDVLFCDVDIFEIICFCFDCWLIVYEWCQVCDMLVSVFVDYVLVMGIFVYSVIVEMGWFQQIFVFGWCCMLFGFLCIIDGVMLVVFCIEIMLEMLSLLEFGWVIVVVLCVD